MKAYSLDLRERIVRAARTQSYEQVALQFSVGSETVFRYVRQQALTGQLTPKHSPGRPAQITASQEEDLRTQLQAHPDATLAQHCDLWEESHQVRVSRATMCRVQARLGWTRKKNGRRQRAQRGGAGSLPAADRHPAAGAAGHPR